MGLPGVAREPLVERDPAASHGQPFPVEHLPPGRVLQSQRDDRSILDMEAGRTNEQFPRLLPGVDDLERVHQSASTWVLSSTVRVATHIRCVSTLTVTVAVASKF